LLRAVIVGGGIGGLTTAFALRRAGLEVVVLEKAGELREIGAGISIWVNAVEALERMGLADAVQAAGREEIEAEIRTSDGATLSRLPLGKRFGRNVILTRSALQRVLLAALEEAGVPVRTGAECVGFKQDGFGVVAFLSDGEERGDLLVGADGLNSVIRRRLFGDERPRYAGFTAWRGMVDLEHHDEAFEAWGRGSVFGLAGLGRGHFYWYATRNAPEGQADSQAGRKAELLERFGGWHEPVPAVILATEEAEILRHDIYDREPLKRWGEGRVTLLGDAAHPMTPNLGQGACQAIEDAVVLADAVRETDSAASALRSYEARRIGRTGAVVRASRSMARVLQVEDPLLCGVRDAGVRFMPSGVRMRRLDPIVGYEV
jgi:2-polyprenyl-6-methoxyphenol hydroxylase-like FAD-dependent oxidoreductase